MRVSIPKSEQGRGTTSPRKNTTFRMQGKKHWGECLVGTENCFRCGKSGNKIRDLPNVKHQDKGSGQASG